MAILYVSSAKMINPLRSSSIMLIVKQFRHLELFQDDNSSLYKRVEIIDSTTFHLPYVILEFQTADRSG